MRYLTVAEVAKLWNIPENAMKPVRLVFNAAGVKDVLLELFNKIVCA